MEGLTVGDILAKNKPRQNSAEGEDELQDENEEPIKKILVTANQKRVPAALCKAPKEQAFLEHGVKSADFQQC